MRKLKTLLVLLVLSFFTIGNLWGANVTYTFNTDAGLTALGISKPSTSQGTDLGTDPYTLSPVSMAATNGSTNTRVYNSSGSTDLRIYKGGSLTFSVTGDYKLTSIVFAGNTTNVFSVDEGSTGTFSTDTWTAVEQSTTKSVKLNATATGKINTITVNYESTVVSCTNEINITKADDPANGTFVLDNSGKVCIDGGNASSTITATPNKHYHLSNVSSTVGTVGDIDGNSCTVTNISANTIISVEFAEDTKYTVTWNVNGATFDSVVYNGEKPVFPVTPVSPNASSTTFVGWATAAWEGKSANLNDKTVYTSAAAMPAVSSNGTIYYAVFAKVNGESSWTETAIGSLTSDDVFVFSTGSKALTNDNGTSSAPGAATITVANSKITSTVTDNIKWNISGNSTDGYTFYPNGSTTTWLYCNTTASSSSNNNMRVGTGDRKLFVADNSGYLKTKDTYTARYLSYYSDGPDFRGYTGTGNGAFVPKFYKYVPAPLIDYMTTCHTITKVENGGDLTLDPSGLAVCQGEVITLTATSPDGSHQGSGTIKVIKTGANPEEDVTETVFNQPSAGKLTMPAYDITISATYAEKTNPSITVKNAVTSLDFGRVKQNGTAVPQSFVISGLNLEEGQLKIESSDESVFTVSPTSIDVNGTLSDTTITVTPVTANAGTFNSDFINISGGGLANKDEVEISLSLTVRELYTVNWYINNAETPASTQTDTAGIALEIPDDFSAVANYSDYHFIGWKDGSAIAGGSSIEKPSLANVGEVVPAANKSYYAVFAQGTPASINTPLNESLSSGISTEGWTFNNYCYTLNSAVRISSGDNAGVMTSPALSSYSSDASSTTISFEVKAWGGSKSENGKVTLSASKGTFATSSYTTSSYDDFEEVSTTLSGGDATTTITFTGAAGYRISIKNVKVEQTILENFSKYYTSWPSYEVTFAALSNGSIKKGSNIVVSGNEYAEGTKLTVTPAEGYMIDAITIKKSSDNSDVKASVYSNGVITMPDYAITISATFKEDISTGFDNLESDVKAVKVLRDGQIYILRGEKTFNAQGQLVK